MTHKEHASDELSHIFYDSDPLLQYLDTNNVTVTFCHDGFIVINCGEKPTCLRVG